MTYIESSLKVRRLLAKASNTEPDDWFLCLKARYGMQLVYKAIFDTLGSGEVITTPYTCITSINPILVSHLTPIYDDIDIDKLSLNKPNPELYHKGKTRAIVMQHTLGIMGNKKDLVNFARKHKLLLIEDSAHCLTRMHRDEDQQISADISVHSFGAEKVLTRTKFGGAIYLNPKLKEKEPELYNAISNSLLDIPQPSTMDGVRIRSYRMNNAILQRLPANIKTDVRQACIKAHILEPPVLPHEQEGKQARAYAPNLWVVQKILEQLPTLPLNYKRRLQNIENYNKTLKSKRFEKICQLKEPLLAYPILFEDQKLANQAYDLLSSSGYYIRRWYSPLLYPGPKSNRKYHYNPKNCPVSEVVSNHILCLPTDIKDEDCKKLISILNDPNEK